MPSKKKINIKNKDLKRRIVDITYKNKTSHLSSTLTAVDIIKDIYDVMGLRDRFVLSQGQAGLALYVVLESLGKGDAERMFEDMGTHPTRKTLVDWGIDCSTGSLGHGIGVALGMALADRTRDVYCLISDGECMEGSVREALRLRNDLNVTNLKVYLNFNGHDALDMIPEVPVKESFVIVYQTNDDYLPFLHGVEGHSHCMTEGRIQFSKGVSQVISLNELDGADKYLMGYAKELADKADHPLVGCVFGVAYGGEVEEMAKVWKGKGTVYGYDTFEGHPKFMSKDPHPFSLDKECMEFWYEKYGKDKLTYEYQREELNKQGLDNAVLIKGLIHKDSCKDLPYVDLAILDLDILESTLIAYDCIKDKYVDGNRLFLHDVVPPKHIKRLGDWYTDVLIGQDGWVKVEEHEKEFLAVLGRSRKEDLKKRIREIVKDESILSVSDAIKGASHMCLTCGVRFTDYNTANEHTVEHVIDKIALLLDERRETYKKYETKPTA